jgi:putative spermidine/putrescine transport system substrate-binding protein
LRATRSLAALLGAAMLVPLAGIGATAQSPSTGTAPLDPSDPVIAELIAATQTEGAINSYGMPDSWTNFGEIFANFTTLYGAPGTPLTHTDTDMSSAEEISKMDAEKNNPVADIGDIGILFGPIAVNTGVAECYKATVWDSIPDYAKDPNGCWTGWYQGTISFAVNPDATGGFIPQTWEDLKNPALAGKVAISDPIAAAQGQFAVLAAAFAHGGDETNIQPGIDFFQQLNDTGNLSPLAPTQANLEKGEIGVGIVWDYIALPMRDELAGVAPIEVVIPSDGTTSSPYVALLNTYGAHKNAAKLLLEYVLSDEGQIIQAKKYARPIRDDVVLPPDIAAAFPPPEAYAAVKPVNDWVQAATIGPSLAESWTIPVGQGD